MASDIQTNVSLKPYNTFGIDQRTTYFAKITSVQSLLSLLSQKHSLPEKLLILGGGSNMLLLRDFEGLVLKMEIEGIEKISENQDSVWIKSGAGVNWHHLVLFAVGNNWGGIENLSLIPGTVGAAPIQNIGAYGVELKDVFESLEALNLETLKIEQFNNADCKFGYRNSFFKNEGKGKYIITSVTLKLSKNPPLNLSYGAIKETLNQMHVGTPTIKTVSDAVISIRKSKLPDPDVIGNAGSFFKNPEIPKSLYQELVSDYPKMPSYHVDAQTIKVPAGWLIEQAGWKGYRKADAGVHIHQALVLVNYGNAKGQEIKQLAEQIQESVYKKFNIRISPEVNFII